MDRHDHGTHPVVSDDAVARLPLADARAALLEEIMSTPTTVEPDATTEPRPPRRRWAAPLAVAAAVAVLAAGTAWWAARPDDAPPSPPVASAPDAADPATDYRAVLDAPGWEVDDASVGDQYGGSVSYEKGGQSLEVNWYPAESYRDYVQDRRHITEPPSDGDPVTVLGAPAQTWAYSADDHTMIREVRAGHWMEARGEGMDRAAYLDLLGRLRLVDRDGFEASLPDGFVTAADRGKAVADIVDGIAGVVDPLPVWPGRTPAVESDDNDRYQLGATVSGTVACAWLGELRGARDAGDAERAARAEQVLATTRDWPVLQEMDDEGDYPEVLWEITGEAVDGPLPVEAEQGLGCD